MKTELYLDGAKVMSVDVEKLAEGVADMHIEDEGMFARARIGMLDAKLFEVFERELETSIRAAVGRLYTSLYEDEVVEFIKKIKREVGRKVYKYIPGMIV